MPAGVDTSYSTCMTPCLHNHHSAALVSVSPQAGQESLSLAAFRHVWRRGGCRRQLQRPQRLICLIGAKGKLEKLSGLRSALPCTVSHYAYNLGQLSNLMLRIAW